MPSMDVSALASSALTSPAAKPGTKTDPQRAKDAAKQFEALLIGQMMRSFRQGSAGWLGVGDDQAGECATGFAEQQFAQALAAGGGLGIARLVEKGLTARK